MPSLDIANFLTVALDVQNEGYAGVHVSGGVAAATDGAMLVVADWGSEFLRGEGTISPRAVLALAALAEATNLGGIDVDGNRVIVVAQSTRYEERGGEVTGDFQTIPLPDFYCPHNPAVVHLVRNLTDAEESWVPLAENPVLKNLRTLRANDCVVLSGLYGEGYELFHPKTEGDTLYYYSVARLRRGLKLFGARARLSVRRSARGWLVFEDGYQKFAIAPFAD
jgi:hypothetical protein